MFCVSTSNVGSEQRGQYLLKRKIELSLKNSFSFKPIITLLLNKVGEPTLYIKPCPMFCFKITSVKNKIKIKFLFDCSCPSHFAASFPECKKKRKSCFVNY